MWSIVPLHTTLGTTEVADVVGELGEEGTTKHGVVAELGVVGDDIATKRGVLVEHIVDAKFHLTKSVEHLLTHRYIPKHKHIVEVVGEDLEVGEV